MSKRKRANTPADESGDDSAVKDDMVHVTPDMLSGTDIFASKGGSGTAPPPPPADPEVVESPVATQTATEPGETGAAPPPDPAPEAPPPSAIEPPPPPFAQFEARPSPARRGGNSTAALGVVLIVLGVFALTIVLSGVDLTQYGWPLFVLVPGLTLLVLGFVGMGAIASIPGGIVTMLGLVLGYQNSTGDWPTWAFAWSLVIPFGLGLGMYLQALRDRDVPALRRGRTLMFVGLMIFIFGFVFFESILGISGRDYGGLGKAAIPLLLILIGLVLLVRAIQRSRRPA